MNWALLLLAPVAVAAGRIPTGDFVVAGEHFAPAQILDARAMPDIGGKVGVMVTLAPAGAKRLETLTETIAGKPMLVTLDGQPLVSEMIRAPIRDGVIEIPGRYSIIEAEALAKRISGKEPVPDDLAD